MQISFIKSETYAERTFLYTKKRHPQSSECLNYLHPKSDQF